MPVIKPISELRNNFKEINALVNDQDEPIFFTSNGKGTMVVMSMDYYDAISPESRIKNALIDAQQQALSGASKKDFDKVADEKRAKLERRLKGASHA